MRQPLKTWWVILCLVSVGIGMFMEEGRAQQTQTPPEQQQPGLPKLKDIEELSLEQLLESTITIAAGRAQPLEAAPGIVSVVSAEDIRRIGARTLAEVLKLVPGFDVLTSNLGQNRIIIRGLTAGGGENVLILFNGHRLNEEITGSATTVNLDIPVTNLERIEIIRGPGSALFGADALAGVINLVPYTTETFEGLRLSAGGGSFATQQYNLLAGRVVNGVSLSGFVQYSDTDGAQRVVEADVQTADDCRRAPLGVPPVSRAPSETDDERRSVDANVQIAYKGLALNARVKDERSGGFIGLSERLSDSELENRQMLFDARYRHALGERGGLLAKFSFTQNEMQQRLELLPPGFMLGFPEGDTFPDGVIVDFTFNSRRFGGEIILDYRLFPQHHITLGVGFANESTFGLDTRGNVEASPTTLEPLPSFQELPFDIIRDRSRDIFSVFVQDIWDPLPGLEVTLGVRYDHFSDFGDTVNPRASVVWRFAGPFHLKLLYGRAFRAPSFFELSFNATTPITGFRGNSDLDPMTLQAFEAALGYTGKRVRISANYFLTLIRDFIEITPSTAPGVLDTYTNSKGIDIQGVEFEVQAQWREHTMFMNYTYQHAEVDETGERVPDVPAHLANIGLSLALGPYLRLTPTLLIRGDRPRIEPASQTAVPDPREDASAYALVNVSLLAHNFFCTLELSATVNNLLDTDYEDPAPAFTVPGDYPRPGRSVFIQATYKF